MSFACTCLHIISFTVLKSRLDKTNDLFNSFNICVLQNNQNYRVVLLCTIPVQQIKFDNDNFAIFYIYLIRQIYRVVTSQQQKGIPMPPLLAAPPTRRLSHCLWFLTYSSGGMASRTSVIGEASSVGISPGAT